MHIQPIQFSTRSLRRVTWGNDICEILEVAINSADAGIAVKKHIHIDAECLLIEGESYSLQKYKRIFVIGAGKAAIPMTSMVMETLGERISSGLIITRDGYTPRNLNLHSSKISFIEASHPIPDHRNLVASSQLSSLAGNLHVDDLVICLISGGGSSLLVKPAPGIPLAALQALTGVLLACGTSISEINTLRKHLDEFKGGGLAKFLAPAMVISLVLSDVIGDPMDMIASGPTVADPTTFRDAWAILEKYQILDQIPDQIRSHIAAGILGNLPETLKPGDPVFEHVHNVMIGNNFQAIQTACQFAEAAGFTTHILSTTLQGEAAQVGPSLLASAREFLSSLDLNSRPACLVAGGETTVTLKGNGMGGRNQELALGSVISLAGSKPMVMVSLATDGVDGPTDAAGAVATHETLFLSQQIGLDPADYLSRNDSYHYFAALDDLIKIGPTLTNVNDLVFIFAF